MQYCCTSKAAVQLRQQCFKCTTSRSALDWNSSKNMKCLSLFITRSIAWQHQPFNGTHELIISCSTTTLRGTAAATAVLLYLAVVLLYCCTAVPVMSQKTFLWCRPARLVWRTSHEWNPFSPYEDGTLLHWCRKTMRTFLVVHTTTAAPRMAAAAPTSYPPHSQRFRYQLALARCQKGWHRRRTCHWPSVLCCVVCSSVCGSVQQQEGLREHEKMNHPGIPAYHR